MENVELLFKKTTEKYNAFIAFVNTIEQEMSSISPDEILTRCNRVKELQEDIAPNDKQIAEIMTLVGPEILDAPYIGDYQRALAKAELACDTLSAKANVHKAILTDELRKIKKSQKGVAQYSQNDDISGSMLTKNF